MADSVLSVRIDEDIKKKFIELAAAHEVGNKDLLQLMLAHFELEKAKTSDHDFSRDIEELQRIGKRVADIYIHMTERAKLHRLEEINLEKSVQEEIKKEGEGLKMEIAKLKGQLESLDVVKASLKEKTEEVKAIRGELATLKELNTLLQQKNSQLESREQAMTESINTAARLKEENQSLKNQWQEKNEELKRQIYETKALQQKEKEFGRLLEEQAARFKEELSLKDRGHSLAEKEIRLEAQMEQAQKLEDLKKYYEEKIMESAPEKEGEEFNENGLKNTEANQKV